MFVAVIGGSMLGGKKLNTTVNVVYMAAKMLIGRPQRPSDHGPKLIFPPRSRLMIIRVIGIKYDDR